MMDTVLNLPSFAHRIQIQAGKQYIFDILRKKYIHLTSEEWVRQHMIHYLIDHLHYPAGLMNSEYTLPDRKKPTRRVDIFVYNRQIQPLMIVECKSPKQKFSKSVLHQMIGYNRQKTPLLVFTNGLQHFCFAFDPKIRHYTLLKKMPLFDPNHTY